MVIILERWEAEAEIQAQLGQLSETCLKKDEDIAQCRDPRFDSQHCQSKTN